MRASFKISSPESYDKCKVIFWGDYDPPIRLVLIVLDECKSIYYICRIIKVPYFSPTLLVAPH